MKEELVGVVIFIVVLVSSFIIGFGVYSWTTIPRYQVGDCYISTLPIERWEKPGPAYIIVEEGSESYRKGTLSYNGTLYADGIGLWYSSQGRTKKIVCPSELEGAYKDWLHQEEDDRLATRIVEKQK
jgi:hypothetical protein